MTVEIALRRVTKTYRGSPVLRDVSFSCSPGTVTAFCGPNGAGKSTALRILTGISRPDSGAATINGRPLLTLDSPARSVGVLLDASAFHPGRSVQETLRLGAFCLGEPRARADECAALVGLLDVRRRRVGQLSLGMRQRLGIAHALIGRPSALVLDEPSNGLDPHGIDWLDGLLRQFAENGGTVLVATHHLAAVERTADRLVAISRGCMVADVAVAEVQSTRTHVSSGDPRLGEVLQRAGVGYVRSGDGLIADLPAAEVGRIACVEGVALTELRGDDRRLDDFLASVTANQYEGTVLR